MELNKAVIDCMRSLRRRLRDEQQLDIHLNQPDAVTAMLAGCMRSNDELTRELGKAALAGESSFEAGIGFGGEYNDNVEETAHNKKADFITLQQGVALRNITDFYCRAAGFTPHVILESDNPGTVREFIKAGLGVSFAPRITWYGVGGDHVALVPIATPGCQRYISLSWDENTPLTPPAEELKNYFIKNFKRFAEQYAGVNSSM